VVVTWPSSAAACWLRPGAEEGELRHVLAEAERSSDGESEVCALDGLARSAAVAGDLSGAASLLERADARAAMIAHLLDPPTGSTPRESVS
jgi:hypothetical protein